MGRFFRPAPENDNGSDTIRDSAADSSPFEEGTTEPPSPSLQVDSRAACTVHAALRHDDSSELKGSNEGQESREEEFDPTGNDEAGLCHDQVHENKQHQTEIKKSSTGGGSEVSKTDSEKEVVGSGRPGGVVTGEDMEEFEACAEDKRRADTRGSHQKMDEAETEDHREGFHTEDGEVKMCTFTDSPEEEDQILKIEAKHGNDFEEKEQDQNGEQLQLISESKNKPNEKREESKDQLTPNWKLLEDVKVNEATEIQAAAEEPKMENSDSVADDRHHIFDQFVTSSQEDVQTTEAAHKQEDVVVTYVQTTAETEIIPSEISVSSKSVDGDSVEEERLAREVNNKSIGEKKVSTAAPDMVKPESETEQEMSGEFKNIPMRIIEGQGVVPQKLNPQACKEAQEGVPEHNNEFQPDENTTQRFREGGNCQEIQITQLPEKVGNKEEESLKNSRTGADCLLMEVKQASNENSLDLNVELHRNLGLTREREKPITQTANLESEHLIATTEAKAEESSMKTEIKPVDKEFETYTGSADETDELQDGAESADFGIEGVSSDSKETPGHAWEVLGGVATDKIKGFTNEALEFPETEVEKKDMRFCQDFASQAEKDSSFSFPEEVTTSELQKEPAEAEPTFLDDSTVEIEEMDEAQADVQVRCESLCLEVEATGIETTANFNLSPPSETQESENQFQDKALEMNEREKADTGVVEKLKTSESKELPELLSEKICEPFRGHQDVIDEDILDLWIEAAMSEDFQDTELRKSKLEKDIVGDLLEEEPGKKSLKETEQLEESNSGKFVSETSSAVESGTLIGGSLQDGRDISGASPDFSAQNVEPPEGADQTLQLHLEVEEEDITELRSDTDSGVSSPEEKHQESNTHQERIMEELPDRKLDMTSEETACRDKDFESLGIWEDLSQVGAEPIEMGLSDSPDGIKLSESEQQRVWLEDITESLHQDTLEQNRTEVWSPRKIIKKIQQ